MVDSNFITEKSCQERHAGILKEIIDIKKDISSFLKLWNGNGEPGIGFKVRTMWEYHQQMRKSTQGFVDWLFRAVVMILLTFISIKLGLQ